MVADAAVEILYEDNHCLAVVKRHGQLTQADDTGDPSLMDEVKAFVKERDRKPGAVFLGLLHRLDRPVGGIVLFAKTSKGASRLSEQFRSRRIGKAYLAVAEGRPAAESGTVRQWLLKDRDTNVVRAAEEGTPGAKEAVTGWLVLGSGGGRSLVEARPETGRPHQIRLAMASLGTPILGDGKYGSSVPLGGAIALFASRLDFFQPVTGEPVSVRAEPDRPEFRDFIHRP